MPPAIMTRGFQSAPAPRSFAATVATYRPRPCSGTTPVKHDRGHRPPAPRQRRPLMDGHSQAAVHRTPPLCAAKRTAGENRRVSPGCAIIASAWWCSFPEGHYGSGEVIRSGGYVLTNNHVISVAAASGGSVQVLFADGQTAPATI